MQGVDKTDEINNAQALAKGTSHKCNHTLLDFFSVFELELSRMGVCKNCVLISFLCAWAEKRKIGTSRCET